MVPPWNFYSPFGTPKEAKTIIGPCCRIFSNGQFYTPKTQQKRILKGFLITHYFLFKSSSALCGAGWRGTQKLGHEFSEKQILMFPRIFFSPEKLKQKKRNNFSKIHSLIAEIAKCQMAFLRIIVNFILKFWKIAQLFFVSVSLVRRKKFRLLEKIEVQQSFGTANVWRGITYPPAPPVPPALLCMQSIDRK